MFENNNVLKVVLIVLVVILTASGWIAFSISHNNTEKQIKDIQAWFSISDSESTQLQISFIKSYPQLNATQLIVPKIYEIASEDNQGNKYVMVNVGGVWTIISSTPAPQISDK